jgi:hypothetical protein
MEDQSQPVAVWTGLGVPAAAGSGGLLEIDTIPNPSCEGCLARHSPFGPGRIRLNDRLGIGIDESALFG